MKITGTGQKLRIFVGETDSFRGKPIYEAIVLKAREMELAGASVFKGIEGYGASSRVHTSKILRLSENLPVVIDIVDNPKRIVKILEEIDLIFEESGCGGLVTVEELEIIKYAPATEKNE